ncbi:MAG: NAD-dependent epimerase/dehydratase family protein [Gammaproteobacteria bacterium]|nr:NAD-dependent epimerase/dehydratase family protein [Gammaproteobacteria bacterium]
MDVQKGNNFAFQDLTGARVLITGGAGFIGNHLARMLLERAACVRVLDNLSTGTSDHLPDAVDLQIGDVLNIEELGQALQGIDIVFHLASVVGMRLAANERKLAYKIATVGTRNLLDHESNIPVVLFSSSAVYGIDGGNAPLREIMAATNNELLICDGGELGYASGKARLEKMGAVAAENGRQVLCVRPFNVIGPGQTGKYGMVMPGFITRALQGKPLTIYDDGLQSRAFGSVTTFVEILLELVKNPDSWVAEKHIVNVGNPHTTTVLELAKLVLQHTGSSSPIEYIPYNQVFPGQRDTRDRMPDCNRLESLVGPVEWPEISEVVATTVANMRSTASEATYPTKPVIAS